MRNYTITGAIVTCAERAAKSSSFVTIMASPCKACAPDRSVPSFAQSNVFHMLCLVTGLTKPMCERRRQLGIDQELHRASDKTA